ncbi:DUF2283 domain-containing protein [Motilimonas cestriensis]|uniref:DUF2283 domain-containing protein n=1 Tax=Motilimonas cestriensis TaxID=2742685 RepID=A0ABS8W4G1_9GAMM|nr:DUF2283 domain-containing protein [Motilimonas cestriensis]MCE2593851.1 DUF2283 domain-containing protein [Motilimonas cestriensis]
MTDKKMNFEVSKYDSEIAYLSFPAHPGKGKKGIVMKQKELSSLIEGYKGPEVYLDFDENGELIGMEILL